MKTLLIIIALLVSTLLNANDNEPQYRRVELNDGSEFIGTIIQESDTSIKMQTLNKINIEIDKEQILTNVKVYSQRIQNGSYYFENPNSTRYFVGPTAFNLKKGESYYQNSYLLINSYNYGVTDYFSIGGGFEFFSTFAAEQPVIFFTPKVSFEAMDDLRLGAGLLYISSFGMYDTPGSGGIAFTNLTYGNTDNNFTLSYGNSFKKTNFEDGTIISLSGMYRVSKQISLVTENWYMNGQSEMSFVSYGVRFFGESLAVDLGLFNNLDIAQITAVGIPYVDFVYNL